MIPRLLQYKRILKLDLPQGQSAFLWGARKTGKSTYLLKNFPNSIRYDLLKSELYLKYAQNPHYFRKEILSLSKDALKHPVIVDEVQRVPFLLNEIHWLIENSDTYFILCGSSARKLRRGAANLLGGRAWKYHFYPLVYPEVNDFDLLKILNVGLIPSHYLSNNPKKSLQSYVQDYLTEEIKAEGLVRELPSFARFLDTFMFSNGELTNFANIARECGIDAKTVRNYYEILVDTLLGYFVLPYRKKIRRDIISAMPKFYLFDVGVAGFLAKRKISVLKGAEAGKSFENYVLMELMAYRGINDLDFEINFWRTVHGLEVDFILDRGRVAVEVKIKNQVEKQDIKGLIAFTEEHVPEQSIVVSLDSAARKIDIGGNREILVLPYKVFLKRLWSNEII
ncbi:MAG: AAA family ATPase [Gammaproteobacteria bacterium]|jgi:predicted AAA+ superfamily ATPase